MRSSICPKFSYTAMLLSRRWSGQIVALLLSGAKRFTDIQLSVACSAKVLSQRLKELELDGVIERVPCKDCAHDAYALTRKGEQLKPVLDAMRSWGELWA